MWQISGRSWTNNWDVWTTGWRRKFRWLESCRIFFGAELKLSQSTAKAWTNSRKAFSVATKGKSKSKFGGMFLEPCVSALPRRLFVFQFIFLYFTWKGNDDKNCDKRTANFVLVLSSSEKEPRPDDRPDKLLPFCLAATDTHTHEHSFSLSSCSSLCCRFPL